MTASVLVRIPTSLSPSITGKQDILRFTICESAEPILVPGPTVTMLRVITSAAVRRLESDEFAVADNAHQPSFLRDHRKMRNKLILHGCFHLIERCLWKHGPELRRHQMANFDAVFQSALGSAESILNIS